MGVFLAALVAGLSRVIRVRRNNGYLVDPAAIPFGPSHFCYLRWNDLLVSGGAGSLCVGVPKSWTFRAGGNFGGPWCDPPWLPQIRTALCVGVRKSLQNLETPISNRCASVGASHRIEETNFLPKTLTSL